MSCGFKSHMLCFILLDYAALANSKNHLAVSYLRYTAPSLPIFASSSHGTDNDTNDNNNNNNNNASHHKDDINFEPWA